MKKMIKFVALLLVATALSSMTASAIPTNITVDNAGNLLNVVGIASDGEYAQGNNNPVSNLAFLNTEISRWNGAFNPDLPAAVGPVALDQGSLSGNAYNALTGYEYVVFHFGNGGAGSPGGWWQAFYLGGGGGSFSTPSVNNNTVGGFSSARYFGQTTVPDGGMTLVLLGSSLTGLAFLARSRKFNANK